MDSMSNLTAKLAMLPGVGKKTAARLAYAIISWEDEKALSLADAITSAKENIRYCSVCFNLTDADPCPICSSGSRDKSSICVVAEAKDVSAIERTGEFKGLYHVLGGLLSPMEGIGAEDIRIRELIARLSDDVSEVILATNLSVEGETTSSYIARMIKPLGIKTTRLARGIPTGAEIEYTDEATLAGALISRREI